MSDADASGGHILTKPLRLNGSKLFVNADARGGTLKVELLDARMKPIPGFALADARAIRSDGVRVQCRWKSGRNLSGLAKRTVRVRCHLVDASLYAFWCE